MRLLRIATLLLLGMAITSCGNESHRTAAAQTSDSRNRLEGPFLLFYQVRKFPSSISGGSVDVTAVRFYEQYVIVETAAGGYPGEGLDELSHIICTPRLPTFTLHTPPPGRLHLN